MAYSDLSFFYVISKLPMQYIAFMATKVALLVFGIIILLSGLGLIFKPKTIMTASKAVNKWIDSNSLFNLLDSVVGTDDWFFSRAKLIGSIFIIGSSFLLVWNLLHFKF